MKVFKVFNDEELITLNKYIDQSELKDGTLTALGPAKERKKNLQITNLSPDYEKFKPFVSKAHMNTQVSAYTFMQKLLSPRVAVYREGGFYGWHVDTPIMDLQRADLSFTIFLNSGDDYQGGELELELNGVKAKVKGKPGEVIIYASGVRHRVLPVTSGERRVIVGWLKSNVKLHEYRERLYNLNVQLSRLRQIESDSAKEITENLNTIYNQMVRDYS